MFIRRVAPSPSRTGCGTAQNATVARRSVFERGSTFPLRGAPPPPTLQHRFNAASAWAKRVYAFCGGVNPVPRGGGVPRVPAGGGGGYNIKHLRGKTKKRSFAANAERKSMSRATVPRTRSTARVRIFATRRGGVAGEVRAGGCLRPPQAQTYSDEEEGGMTLSI